MSIFSSLKKSLLDEKTFNSMASKVFVVITFDASSSLFGVKDIITGALRNCVTSLKTDKEFINKDIVFSLIPYSSEVKKESLIINTPVKNIQPSDINIKISGSTNPATALKLAQEIYDDMKAQFRSTGVEGNRMVLINFSDGKPFPENPCQTEYEEIAAQFRKLDEENEIVVCSAAFGTEADIKNLRLLSAHPARVLDVTDGNTERLKSFFTELIPATISHSVTHTDDQIDAIFIDANNKKEENKNNG